MIVPVRGMTVTVNGVSIDVDGLTVEIPDLPPPEPPSGSAPVFFEPFIGGAGGESGQAYSTQRGYYIQTGKLLNLWAYLQFSAKGMITGALQLKGIPKAAYLPMFFSGVCAYWSNLSPNAAQVSAILIDVPGDNNYARIRGAMLGQNQRDLTTDDINDATQLMFHVAYVVD